MIINGYKLIIAMLVALVITTDAKAQKVINGNTNTWHLLLNRLTLSDKWSITNEVHYRYGDVYKDKGQLLVRPSLDYHLDKNIELNVGYSYIHVWPYEPYNHPLRLTEHNIWTQALLTWKTGKVKFQNRFRQEHRFTDNVVQNVNGEFEKEGTNYTNRFRYRFTASLDVIKLKKREHSIFFNGFDEIWINQSDNLVPLSFARNWLYLGLGYKVDDHTNFQIGYMNQYDYKSDNNYISSPIIQVTVFKGFKLSK